MVISSTRSAKWFQLFQPMGGVEGSFSWLYVEVAKTSKTTKARAQDLKAVWRVFGDVGARSWGKFIAPCNVYCMQISVKHYLWTRFLAFLGAGLVGERQCVAAAGGVE